MRTTADHAADRPEDRKAPGAALVHSAATDRIPELADLGRVHIMGIAGFGMSALARILFDRGLPVSGCEPRESITVVGLRALGADVVIGHSPRHLDDTDTFVFTTAINPRHEELVAAPGRAAAGPAPGRRAGRPPVRRGSLHPRQDLDDLAAGGRAAGVRPGPALRHRRQPLRDRQERAS
ncbi:MAG: UDP-N-acetylmuramate/alanine ligase [Chloroflexi bacterium]|nr:UDP-N-acetylmuramate/alanine ligase [Chloroflexota bacterium]